MSGSAFFTKYRPESIAVVCRHEISDYWIRLMKKVSDFVYYIKGRPGKIHGFIVVSKFTRKSFTVDLLCSNMKGKGKQLMNHVIAKYGMTHRMTLSPLPGLVKYYETFGFRKVDKKVMVRMAGPTRKAAAAAW
mgnify:CR=1 FL=1